MAGKIIADQIEHSTAGSLDTSYVVNGSAKAWVTFSGDGTTVRDSSNTSSLVDDGTGIFSYNLTSSMGNANYASNSSASYVNSTNNYATYISMNYVGNLSATRTTSQNNVGFWETALADPGNDACSSILGDLA